MFGITAGKWMTKLASYAFTVMAGWHVGEGEYAAVAMTLSLAIFAGFISWFLSVLEQDARQDEF